jgi:exosortase D (VPLPA-CTERM-specific)
MKMDSVVQPMFRRHHASTPAGVLWLTLAVAAPIPLFWFGFEGLARVWTVPGHEIRAAVPLASLLMFVQVLRTLPAAVETRPSRWCGVLLTAIALALALLGNLALLDDLVIFAMVVWVGGLIVTVFGLRRSLSFWAPAASLTLMFPFPGFVYWPVVDVLQRVSVAIGMSISRAGGASPTIDGQLVEFGMYQLRIDDASSTLTGIFPLVLLALLFATFWRGRFWMRVLPLLISVPVVVLMTGLRIGLLGILANGIDVAAPQNFLAASAGWVFVAACLAAMVPVFAAFRFARTRRRIGEAETPATGTTAGFAGLSETSMPRAMTAVAVMSAILSAAFVLTPSRAVPEVARDSFSLFPPEIGDWAGSSTAIAWSTEWILDADDYMNIDYNNPAERAPINLWSAYYYEQTREAGAIHSPQVCLPGGGWNIVSFGSIDFREEGAVGLDLQINRMVITKDGAKQLVYYWFEGRGKRVANEFFARALVKLDRITKGRTDGALVRLVTPVLSGETEDDADARLRRFAILVLPRLPRHIPE